MDEKVIIAMANGALHIDPSDVSKVNLEEIKSKMKEKLGYVIPIVVAPISFWMTESGTEALMEEAVKKMSFEKPVVDYPQSQFFKNRHARRVLEAKNRKKH